MKEGQKLKGKIMGRKAHIKKGRVSNSFFYVQCVTQVGKPS